MNNTVKYIYVLASAIFLIYLVLPSPDFPEKMLTSLQSVEPGDSETLLRRAYFTDEERKNVLSHYEDEFKLNIFGIGIPNYRLNYPPEEAQVLVRDQTKSSYLEEIVYPFRDSLYVNGFEPISDKDALYVEEKHWKNKVTVKHVKSNVFVRVGIAVFVIILVTVICIEYFNSIKRLKNISVQ